ncbi:MAG: hypothetical protein IPH37_11430 [Burkholderiales bacterium]|nr:hypothetical protein [Burkholderiales bacterium]
MLVLLLMYAVGIQDAAYAFSRWLRRPLLAFVWGHGRIRQTQTDLVIALHATESLLIEHWQFAKWVCLASLYSGVQRRVHPFMLAGQSNYVAVADFNVANSILNALNIVRLMLGNYLPSRVTVVYAEGGTTALRKFLLRILAYSGGAFGVDIANSVSTLAS